MKKIIYGETKEDGSRSFHIVTRGGVCYGRLYDGEWAYVHYNAHQSGIDYMTDMPKKTLLDLVRPCSWQDELGHLREPLLLLVAEGARRDAKVPGSR